MSGTYSTYGGRGTDHDDTGRTENRSPYGDDGFTLYSISRYGDDGSERHSRRSQSQTDYNEFQNDTQDYNRYSRQGRSYGHGDRPHARYNHDDYDRDEERRDINGHHGHGEDLHIRNERHGNDGYFQDYDDPREDYENPDDDNGGDNGNDGPDQGNGNGHRRRKTLIIAAIAIVAIIGIVYFATGLVHINITVNGTVVSVAKNTTYNDVRNMDLVTDDPGDFVAVDGSVLEAGKGGQTKLLDNGTEPASYDDRVSENSVITQERGDDVMEEYSITQAAIPIGFQIDDGTFNFYNGVLHTVISNGKEGSAKYKVGKTSGISVQDEVIVPMEPKYMKSIYPETDSTDNKVVALTFDDGPHKSNTEQILAVLNQYGVKATFFELGIEVDKYPQISKEVVDAGCQIGSHSYDHDASLYLSKLDATGVQDELSRAQTAIYNATGVTTTTVRPPGGNITYDGVVAGQDYITSLVGWTVDSFDYEKPGADVIVNTVMSKVQNGSVILMHDGGGDRSQTIEALKTIIPELQQQGYTFVTIDELTKLRE